MRVTPLRCVASLCGVTLALGGCLSVGATPLHYSIRRIPHDDPERLLITAENVLKAEGYRIDKVESDSATITTRPLAIAPPRTGDPLRRRGGASSRFRRIATVSLVSSEQDTKVYCKVLIQERDTEMHRLMLPDRGGTDIPTTTPIEREGATTRQQNTVWRTIQRDKAQERRILEALIRPSPSSTPGQPAPHDR